MGKYLRLLLVEDSEDDCVLLIDMLRTAGWEVSFLRVETEAEMRAALKQGEWDLVITDYRMPSFDAPGSIRVLRETTEDIPIIVVSGTVGEDIAVETLKIGADDYLLKQNLTRLAAAVKRALQTTDFRLRRRELEKMKMLIMANSLDLICTLDAQSHLLEVSQAAFNILGYQPSHMIGRKFGDFVSPDDRRRSEDEMVAVRKGHSTKNFENDCIRQSGEVVSMMWSAVWSDEDAVMILVGRDVTERNQKEETLQLRESALGQVSQGVLISDENHLTIYANASFTTLTGHTENDILGKKCSLLQGPATNPRTIEEIRDALRASRAFEGEILNYRKDGTPFWNDLSIAPIRERNGGPIRFVGILRDVTERKKFQEALREETAFFEALVESDLNGILVVDKLGKKFFQNQRVSELWKIPADIADSDDNARQLEFVSSRTKNPEQFSKTVAYLTSHPKEVIRDVVELIDGTILDRYSAPVLDKTGSYYGRIWTFRDVTEDHAREGRLARALALEKELSEKARAGERAKSEFLAVMSHEVRTPLNGILGFAELLRDAPSLSPESRSHAEIINQSGEALLRILDDILDFSRLEASRLKIETIRFSPRSILKDIHSLLVSRAAEKDLQLEVFIEKTIPEYLEGDAGRLRQILLNLAGNAIKFTEQGAITLGLTAHPKKPSIFVFSVKDTGSGISANNLEKIFQPFTQADSSISRRHGGTGLGLTISRRLTELMEGKLKLTSVPGQGSEFLVTLPFRVAAEPAPAASPNPHLPLDSSFAVRHPLRILLVEDDAVNLKLIRTLVRRLGYEALTAENGREAVEIVGRERPDCIFMDLQMPEMDGIEATEIIRKMESKEKVGSPTMFISALTANIFPADRQRCWKAGMNGYLNKPVKRDDLAGMLEKASDFVKNLTGIGQSS